MDFLSNTNERTCDASSLKFQKKLIKTFIILCLTFGLLFIMIEAPFAVPDEDVHYANICRILHGRLIPDVENGQLGSYLTGDEHAFVKYYCQKSDVTGIPNIRAFYHSGLSEDIHHGLYNLYDDPNHSCDAQIFFEHSASGINSLSYVFPVAVLSIVKLFVGTVNPYNILMTSRIVTLLFYIIVTAIALAKTRAFRKTMFLLALMPMTIFQAASISYDATLVSCFFLLFAYLTRLWFDTNAKVRIEDIIVITLTVTMIVCVKVGYSPILLVLFSIPIKKFTSKKQYLACIGCVLGAIALTHGIHNIAMNVAVDPNATNMITEAQIAQREYFNSNFFRFPVIIFNTFVEQSAYIASSFVGYLGWLDIALPRPFIILFYVVLIFTTITEAGDIRGVRPNVRVLSLLSFLAFMLASLYTMYVSWTPVSMESVGGNVINGFQGRYFIPFVLFVLIAISSPLLRKIKIADKLNEISDRVVTPWACIGLVLTCAVLVLKYFT